MLGILHYANDTKRPQQFGVLPVRHHQLLEVCFLVAPLEVAAAPELRFRQEALVLGRPFQPGARRVPERAFKRASSKRFKGSEFLKEFQGVRVLESALVSRRRSTGQIQGVRVLEDFQGL